MARNLRMTPEAVEAHQAKFGRARAPAPTDTPAVSPKPAKYRNVKVKDADGFTFDSRKEARRYRALQLLAESGKVKGIERQWEIPVYVNGSHVCSYFADFVYWEQDANGNWIKRIEDVKSVVTRKHPVYRLKKKLVESSYSCKITEV
jgi:hypothetical protein